MPNYNSVLRVSTNLTGDQREKLAAKLGPYAAASDFSIADVIVLEPQQGHKLKTAEIAAITDRVRQGAALLVTLGPWQQLTSMQLGEVLPAVTWQASGNNGHIPRGPVGCGWFDKDFFASPIPADTTLPFFATVEPMSSMQRGQARYARYERKNPVLLEVVQPGCQLWTRPLLLRDVHIRLRGADHAETPLLVTGRYGAGRTALFGSGFEQLAGTGMLDAVLQWLKPSVAAPAPGTMRAPEISVVYGDRSIEIRLQQNTNEKMDVEVVGRPYTWENAPFGFDNDLNKKLTLTPGKTARVTMKFPEVMGTNFQAIEFCDVFRVKLGVLDTSGANLLLDRELLADFSPKIAIDVQADDIDHWQYPFEAPGSSFQLSFTDRCGARIGAYAYPPGATMHGKVAVANGLRDLTALATVRDETTPENPTVAALIDGALVANKKPTPDGTIAYSMWNGNPNVENVVSFTFPHAVTLATITLVGSYKEKNPMNPESASLELDGKRIASGTNLVERFYQESGRVVFRFAPVTGQQVKLRIPVASGPLRRRDVALTEVRFGGWAGEAPADVRGTLTVNLVRAMDGFSKPLLQQEIALKGGDLRELPVVCTLPAETEAGEFAAYRLEAKFNTTVKEKPVLVLTPPRPLLSNAALIPPDCAQLGFIVTQGYRQCFSLGTGTREHPPGWATPDDLVWAYSRQMKEVGRRARTLAGRLYVTQDDMQHYAQPWRTFLNGEPLFDEAAPNMLEEMRQQPRWSQSDVVKLGNSDRWGPGPQIDTLHGWQDFVEFDAHLRATGKAPLKAKTRAGITDEIHNERESEWQLWQFGRYMHNLRTLRDTFAAQGKRLRITAQGCPVIAGDAGQEVAEIIEGMSDDCTWGMAEGSQSLTTGRQLATLAYNPVWKMSTLLEYGFVSNILNSYEWHGPVCTVEPLRRMYYDRAWRATIWHDGEYRSVFTAGYNENVGISFQMSENDWQQWWQIEERHSLLSPQAPIGAGIVISTIRFTEPDHFRFNADDIFSSSADGVALARVFQRLHEAGISIPFAVNATTLSKWNGAAPLIIVNPEVFVEAEIETLEKLKARGVKMIAISQSPSLAPRVQALFEQPDAVIHLDPATMSSADAEALASQVHRILELPLRFEKGVCGYGFSMSGTQFIVVEEWKNSGYVTEVRLRASTGKQSARACGLNDHRPLAVKRDGADWVIAVPLRPGDGQIVALQQG